MTTRIEEEGVTSLFGLEGKRFMVLGGGQGMGEATVKLLARLGAAVAVVDLQAERAEKVAGELREVGVSAQPFAVDVTDDAALIATIARIEREFGPLDGMATVIGMAGWAPIAEMSLETWDADHRRNLRYFFVAAREVARSLLARQAPGAIVCVASVDGIVSAPNHAAYGAAKAGLVNLVKTMAVEWSGQGIRVNCVAPGGIVTPRIPLVDAAAERQSMAQLPMQRRGMVDDIAKAAAFFLSDMSPYVTGQTLAVDGGYVATGIFGGGGKSRAKPNGVIGEEQA
jgi:NAD(P)-dependent dehydrogenase (short-subunit alcohol dehydrogenase family)